MVLHRHFNALRNNKKKKKSTKCLPEAISGSSGGENEGVPNFSSACGISGCDEAKAAVFSYSFPIHPLGFTCTRIRVNGQQENGNIR